ncbi:uncharacterized protein A4U43_C07F39180 [Asparagus officinalis]|uniref:non-specific serine/threonine protein kinase n=1 Tax=Asparagus officinalis TaxID=4686 RepID=A0A5P1EIS4_ASPOF|nr:uncharacterized protein A4U43_C07F39180 [Asparagus officinalis]
MDSFSFTFINNKNEVTYTADMVNNATLTRLVVNPSGLIQRLVLLDSGEWGQYRYLPATQCDLFGVCGPNSLCYIDTLRACSCLPGFEPKAPYDWALKGFTGGCIRKTSLDCRNGTDGFVPVQRTVLPDTVQATVDMSMSFDECRAECLRNCSCTGFASADIQGCIIWTSNLMDVQMYNMGGQEFYLRLAAADVGTSVNENAEESTREDSMELPLFHFDNIERATNNFSDDNKIGEGGFGPVYKGKLGHEIAVKRLSKASVQGLEELKAEIALAAKLQHRNLVRLLGCCTQGDERMLVYEYMPNKSLDAFLFGLEFLEER